MKFAIGTQLYGLGKELQSDFRGTIEELHRIGFECVEPMCIPTERQFFMPPNTFSYKRLENLIRELEKHNMTIPSVHLGAGMGGYMKPARTVINSIQKLHNRFGVENFVFSGMFSNPKDAVRWGVLLRETADAAASFNCRIIYHNHDVEMEEITSEGKNRTLLDVFFEESGEKVLMQLDIGWAAYAADEISVFEQYADRIIEIHCKDFTTRALSSGVKRDDIPAEGFAAIGSGAVKTAEIIKRLNDLPKFNGTVLIDQDKTGGLMLDDLEAGFRYLDGLRSTI